MTGSGEKAAEPLSADEFADSFYFKDELIDLNGICANALGMKELFKDYGVYIADNVFLVSRYNETSGDYEYDETVKFKKYLDEKKIDLLYVNAPAKYFDDSFFENEFGVKSYVNSNADTFLKRITDAGIDSIDLREAFISEGLDEHDVFYRTDHHWTVASGLFTAKKIAAALNEYSGYDIDLSIYDSDNYDYTEMKNCWVGEQGNKIGVTYSGLDDFTIITPKFPTDFTIDGLGRTDFSGFIDEDLLDFDNYTTETLHYSYMSRSAVNNIVDKVNVLLISDSYSQVVTPFLALSVHSIYPVVLRGYGGNLSELIENGNYDAVVICYSESMIGSHDNRSSSNYKMFSFDGQ